MLKNYLVTAYRNLIKTKLFSIINIFGLAVGMTASLLILHYVQYEKSYDKFYENSDRIYRLRYERTDDAGNSVKFASCCPPAAARIRGKYPEVEKIARIYSYSALVSYEDKKYLEERIFFVEPELFEILKFKFIEGDQSSGMRDLNNAFISETTARKYFGDENPMGKTISMNRKSDYKVVGIFADIPQNTHLKFDMLLPWENLAVKVGPEYTEAWGHTGAYTYLLADPEIDPSAFEKKLKPLIKSECPWLAEYNMTIDLKMQPMTDIHLTSHYMQEYEANGDAESTNYLFIIALFIILMAWVNYLNLSTARSFNRAREVGLRKVVGASRKQLIYQLFTEVILINLIAIICAVELISFMLPYFNQFTGITVDYGLLNQTWFWLALAAMFVIGVFLSGLYPALAISSFRPVTALTGRLVFSARGINLRKVLVAFQFAVGLFLIVATLSVYQQISFMRNQNLGFNMDETLVVKAPRVRDENYGQTFETMRESLLHLNGITKICHVTEVPGRQIYWDAGGIYKVGDDPNQGKNYQIVGIDYDYVDMFDLELAAGRNFSREFSTDTSGLILNETAVQFMGFDSPESAIGRKVDYWGEIFTVIGVLKDFHQQSLREAFEPHIYRFVPFGRGSMGSMVAKINTGDVRELVGKIKTEYDKFFPGNSFDYFFLDDYYNQQYKADEIFGKVYSLFSMLAIIITVLGIYGLSAFSITQLTKEISIRKVLGASVFSIIGMLTREFLILLSVAYIIACPIAYYAMIRWLENYAFRAGIGLGVFVAAGLLTLLITMLTISFQVLRASRTNPVDSLRYE